MKTTEVNDSIIGKRCKCIFTGLMVTGTIEEIKRNDYTVDVKVHFDESHVWGNEPYKYDWAYARLHDEFGSLRYLEIIEVNYKTIQVIFPQTIKEINQMFSDNYECWKTVTLKDWIDTYESSRFTKINDHSAIITSEYYMDCIQSWIKKHIPNAKIQETNY